MTQPTPARRRRRWKAPAALLVAAVVLLAALPWLLTTGPGRSRVEAALNRALAPGRLQFDGLHLSWFGPTRLSNVALLDPAGSTVARVPSAAYGASLFRLLFRAGEPSTLTLDGASLEVERRADGSINLAEALRSVLDRPDPSRDLTIRIAGGSLRYRDPFLAEPSTANAVDLTLRIPAAPNPVAWSLMLGQGDAHLDIQGDFDRWLSRGGPSQVPDLRVGVVGRRWPLVARAAEVDATGRFDGSVDLSRAQGRWAFAGDARLIGLNARGKPLAGDALAIDLLEAGFDVAEGDAGWTIRRLSVNSPLGNLKAEGQLNGPDRSGRQRIDGRVDLAEVARQLPHALRLREGLRVEQGSATIGVDLSSGPGQSSYEFGASLTDLRARDHGRVLTLRDPASIRGRFVRNAVDGSLERLAVKTSFLDLSARGRLADDVALEGTVDLGGLREQLGEWFDLGRFELSGRAKLAGTYRYRPVADREPSPDRREMTRAVDGGGPRYEGRVTAQFQGLRVEGPGWPGLRRAAATGSASATGPADASGWPAAWESFEIKAGSDESGLAVGLTKVPPGDRPAGDPGGPLGGGPEVAATPDRINVRVSGGGIVTLGDRQGSLDGGFAGTWTPDARRLSVSRAAIALTPSDPGRPEQRLALSVKGLLDLEAGELTLESLPDPSPNAIAIGPEGFRVSGLNQRAGALGFRGGLTGDLVGLDGVVAGATGRGPLGLTGRWSADATARGDVEGLELVARLGVDPPSTPEARSGRPNSIAVRAHYSPRLDRLDLSEFTMSTAYGTVDASGQVEHPLGSRKVDLKGKLAPDFAAINAWLVAKVEPGARLDGKASSFRASGTLGDPPGGWKGLDAELGFDLTAADIYGMKFGPSPVVLRARGGTLAFDPISTTLNEGHIRLEPEVDLDAAGGPILRLAKDSHVREARINDEVSRRVLSFVAPVLNEATRASGLVSVDLDHAEFPLGLGRGRQAKVEGAVVFRDVEFSPGPLAGEILGAIGRRDLSLKLDQPVTLTIADGRVNQRGMAIPVGELTRIELAGWVDFDRNLALTATVPVTPAMLGNNPLLSDIASGTKVRLPIRGTLERPEIDRVAFKETLQEMGRSLLARGASRGAMELLMRLARPRDPDAPPPPARLTPEERREKRQEKKALRRGEIPPPSREGPRP